MSSDPQLPSDDEIEAYLRGDDALSKAYRAAKREQPAREVDESVLAFAQQAVRPRRSLRRRWQAPIALAAVLVLGLGLVLDLWREPEVRVPAPARPVAAPAPMAESAIVDEATAANAAAAQEKLAQEQRKRAQEHAQEQARQRAEQRAYQEQMRRESERAESATARDRRQLQMERETTKRRTMQDAAPFPAEAPPLPPPPAAAPAPPEARAFAAAPRAEPLLKSESEASPDRTRNVEASMQESKALASSGWRPARFAGLELGTATRADVVARYGEPESQGVSASDDASADAPRLRYDAYPSLPGAEGLTEFYYEPISQRLLGIRVILHRPMPAQRLVERFGWSEPAQARDWTQPPCESALETKPNATPETEAPHYGVYPQRGAYLFQPAGLVEQIVYEAECSWP